MKKPDDAEYEDAYMKDSINDICVFHSMYIVNKGVGTIFKQIRIDFISIDFSENSFSGNIPESSIGLLKGLRLLLSNAFASNVPSSLANLKNLEALDLSRNQLSGQIPRELGRLSFLSAINFSHNHLEGPVPRSTQFQSQPCSSFVDNPKLTGLEEICGENRVPVPISQESKELLKGEEKVVNWIAAAIAFGPGVFCGWNAFIFEAKRFTAVETMSKVYEEVAQVIGKDSVVMEERSYGIGGFCRIYGPWMMPNWLLRAGG
ncbi:hypothetical protein F2Q69_00028234 [Brassica cretica]|uniref:Leucine-rich repeat-containing N-terminal plant-type domain-containing protein n=1 Tax=Brassica cretica TaxID=69181 RepID=A0A8S9S8U4_BRACR|nr:hypothetical protein F2Q69_00028234 [Brassica cretica]